MVIQVKNTKQRPLTEKEREKAARAREHWWRKRLGRTKAQEDHLHALYERGKMDEWEKELRKMWGFPESTLKRKSRRKAP